MIVDSEALHHRAYDLALAELGKPAVPFPLYAEWFSSRGEGLAWVERTHGIERRALRRRKQEIYGSLLASEARLREGAGPAIERLASEFRLAVATNSPRAEAEWVLERFALAGAFQAAVGREDYDRPKPAPDPFATALVRLGVAARDAVVVEDSYKGLCSAMAAGVPCIAVPNRYTRGGDFRGAARVLDTLEELDAAVVRAAART